MALNCLKMRPNWLKIHFSRDILEAKFGEQGYNPLVQQHIISTDVTIGIESHIDQNFTSYDNLKCYFELKKAKIPPKIPIFALFLIIETSKCEICS